MRRWWLAIAPGPRFTRVVLMNEVGKSVLLARLPHGPKHPQAVQRLSEALGLWCGGMVHVVLAVDGPGAFCFTPQWLAALDQLTGPAPYKIEFAKALLADRTDFADVQRRLRAQMRRARFSAAASIDPAPQSTTHAPTSGPYQPLAERSASAADPIPASIEPDDDEEEDLPF
jgi:hypothetical protein